jgi:excisionase family DNA binding protein
MSTVKHVAIPYGRRFLTSNEAADRLGLSRSALEKWRVEGRGPLYLKIGRKVHYREEDLDSFIRACLRQSTAKEAGNAVAG